MRTQATAQAFADWIATRPRGERALVHLPQEERVEVWPLAMLAYELWDHAEPLPDRAAVILGLPPDATYAHAARLLWCLREDERLAVHSYAEACTALASLAPDLFRRCYTAVDTSVRGEVGEPGWPEDLGSVSDAA